MLIFFFSGGGVVCDKAQTAFLLSPGDEEGPPEMPLGPLANEWGEHLSLSHHGSRMVGGAAKAGVQVGLQGEGAVAGLGGDSPESLTTTEADPESRVLGFLAIHVYVPSWAAVMPLMFRWSWSFRKARPLKAHTYSGSGQDRDTHHSVREVLKSTLMVQPVRAVESWSMATRSGPTVRAGGRETGQWRERAVGVGTRPAGGAPGKTCRKKVLWPLPIPHASLTCSKILTITFPLKGISVVFSVERRCWSRQHCKMFLTSTGSLRKKRSK